MAIDAYCQRVIEDMEATWQRLPISSELCCTHPIPLRATLAIHEGPKEPRSENTTHHNSPQDAVDAALKEKRPVVVFGGPGAGKTSAMKWTARTQAKRVLEGRDPQPAVPVYIDLGAHKGKADLEAVLESVRKDNPEVSEAASILWLLDGLDLLTEKDTLSAGAVLGRAFALQRQGHDIFVCSTRESPAVKSTLDNEAKSLRLSLESLADAERAKWVDTNCPRVKAALTKFDEGGARPFLNTPLLFAMVLSALLDEGKTDKPFRCDEYDGRAGVFHGFVTYALARARGDGRITEKERACLDHQVVEGVFWAALLKGHEDRIPADAVPALCVAAFGETLADAKRLSWTGGETVLIKAGLLTRSDVTNDIAVLHQQFAEYWAARHLARRLKIAHDGGWFGAEVWDQAKYIRLDPILGQALSIASKECDEILTEAYETVRIAVPGSAMQLLVHAGGEHAYDALVSALKDNQIDSAARGSAAYALGWIGDARAVGTLISELRDNQADRVVRARAADALGEIGDSSAVDALIWTLNDIQAPYEVTRCAANALAGIGGARTVDALISEFEDKEAYSDARGTAAYTLARLGDPRTVDTLISALKDNKINSYVRGSAALALGEMGAADAVDALISALKDGEADSGVRWCAANALGQIRDARAVDSLISTLEDKGADSHVRAGAAEALGEIGDARAFGALISAFNCEEINSDLRGSAAYALGRIGDARAFDTLISALKDKEIDSFVRARGGCPWRVRRRPRGRRAHFRAQGQRCPLRRAVARRACPRRDRGCPRS